MYSYHDIPAVSVVATLRLANDFFFCWSHCYCLLMLVVEMMIILKVLCLAVLFYCDSMVSSS